MRNGLGRVTVEDTGRTQRMGGGPARVGVEWPGQISGCTAFGWRDVAMQEPLEGR
jgi:hypothetical protein